MSLKYTEDHEWIQVEGDIATVGITHHAQDALGDVVFVELPEVGASIEAKAVAGVVESVKAAADVYMPVTGEITEVNEVLRADPSLANTDPSSLNAIVKTGPRCPENDCKQCWESTSQRLTCRSSPVVAMVLPSGWAAMTQIGPVCAWMEAMSGWRLSRAGAATAHRVQPLPCSAYSSA